MRVVLITLDNHIAGVVERARTMLRQDVAGLEFKLHACAQIARDEEALLRCRADIAAADILIVNMMFMDDQISLILPDLMARRAHCDAIVCTMSAGEVVKLTRLGGLSMAGEQKGPLALLKKLRGAKSPAASSGAGQMAMLRRLPKLLRFIPGTAQDLRAYFLTMQYWLSGSEHNIANMVRMLIDRYADGPRRGLRGTLRVQPPEDFLEQGVYHPRLALAPAAQSVPIAAQADGLPRQMGAKGRVGLLILRSYLLGRDSAHYDGVIAALEARGLDVVPAFASGLDARPAIEAYFLKNGRATIDALVSLTGFSLVGGPAYNDARAAEDILAQLDVPYLAAHPTEFQTLEQWGANVAGLTPVEQTIMVAIPELDGAISPTVFAGRSDCGGQACHGCERHCTFTPDAQANRMRVCMDRAERLAARVEKLVRLRRTPADQRRVAIVLFNFPPNSGAAGSAAFLGVFESLFATLKAMRAKGYRIDVPDSVDALRNAILQGNSGRYNTDANVAALIPSDALVRSEPHLAEIEATWGPAPGRQLSDGRHVFVLGAEFGAAFVGLQPGFGSEGDPMRLMFERGGAPTHAFSAFYRYIRDDFGADAIVHFGTHGALEFMPGKHVGMSGACWPDRLIADTPNINLYAANNPSEGALAKRRAAATLVSHLTPPVAQAGLHRQLLDLRDALDRRRAGRPADGEMGEMLEEAIRTQARSLGLYCDAAAIDTLPAQLYALEQSLIPEGLHVLGSPPDRDQRLALLSAIAEGQDPAPIQAALLEAIADGASLPALKAMNALYAKGQAAATDTDRVAILHAANAALARDDELPALLHALDGGYLRPAPGGDLLRTPGVVPTGRNIHGFDPFRLPSAFAVADGARQAERVLARRVADSGKMPETVALVLWGADTLKTEGGPIAQALALIGAAPRIDSYGRVAGAKLLPLSEMSRPRIDVVMTLSGIFRDLLPLQTKMLAEAAWLAASADEPEERNFIRKHALAMMARDGVDLETAALRVFSNAEGAYGANVNQLIDSGVWDEEDDLADAFEARKCFAYGRTGAARKQAKVFSGVLAQVDFAYQNLDSIELGVTTLDQYVDTLGGMARAVTRAKGEAPGVYISDQTRGEGCVRSLREQVTLETHTRTLNPRWFEGLLKHGYEGVRQIEAQVTATLGWSATAGDVPHWVYQKISETYMLDDAMRQRLASLNPKASARVASRLIEAHQRRYWAPDEDTLAALRRASEDIEDRLEGLHESAAL